MTKSFKKSHRFTLIELILSVGILALFLFVAANTLVSTLEIKEELEYQYGNQKIKDTGWNILYQDLGFAVGIYYHHVSLWEGPPEENPKGEEVKTSDQKLKEKKKKKGVTSTSDELFILNPSASFDEPIFELVVSKGRMRSSAKDLGFGFRKVKYFVGTNPSQDARGEVLLRTEEDWKQGGGKNSRSTEREEEFNLEEDYRRYCLIENLNNLSFEVYNGTEWVDEWSSLAQGDLPLALRINFDQLGDDPKDDQTRIIPIPISYLILGEPEEEF